MNQDSTVLHGDTDPERLLLLCDESFDDILKPQIDNSATTNKRKRDKPPVHPNTKKRVTEVSTILKQLKQDAELSNKAADKTPSPS